MEDETITAEAEVTTGAEAQPETTTDNAAENALTETQPDPTEAETTTDDDVAWAIKKGVDLNDPVKVAAMLRNADRKVSEAGLAKTKLTKEVGETFKPDGSEDTVVALEQRYNRLEKQAIANQFYVDNPEMVKYDSDAVAILKEKAETNPALAIALGSDLETLFGLARQRHAEQEVALAEEKGRKEERALLAGKQRGSATSSAATAVSTEKSEDQARLERFSTW